MAFVNRSARQFTNTGSDATSSTVGPGSYNVLGSSGYAVTISKAKSQRISYAPFSSSSQRGLALAEYESSPGPGQYFVATSGHVKSASSNAFVSKVRRFSPNRSAMTGNPGPGSYTLKNQWGKPQTRQQKQLAARQQRRGRSKKQPPLVWQKQASAPSIPAPHQSFGYEENGRGQLVLQAAPLTKFRYQGVPGNSAGPGAYNAHKFQKTHTVAVDFSHSKSHRSSTVKKGNSHVGPGSYNPHIKIDTRRAPVLNTSSFASRTTRDHKRVGQTADTDENNGGNGSSTAFSYNPPSMFSKASKQKDPRFQFFSSTVPKAAYVRTAGYAGNPGPGSYDVKSTFNVGNPEDDDIILSGDRVAFKTSASRFKQSYDAVNNPGPGSYVNPSNLAHELFKKVYGRNNTFASSTARFAKRSTENDDVPGPGYYTEKRLVRPQQQGSSFASQSQRFDKGNNNNNNNNSAGNTEPGPGSYNTSKSSFGHKWGDHDGYSSVFADRRNRFKDKGPVSLLTHEPKSHLGPGSYNHKSYVGQNKKGVPRFGEAVRFPKTKMDDIPGPGEYSTDRPDMQLNKRSFNITVG